jgi:hypothetical protein
MTEVPIAAGLLSGVPRQGRVGVGHATPSGVDAALAATASPADAEFDDAIDDLRRLLGRPSREAGAS